MCLYPQHKTLNILRPNEINLNNEIDAKLYQLSFNEKIRFLATSSLAIRNFFDHFPKPFIGTYVLIHV